MKIHFIHDAKNPNAVKAYKELLKTHKNISLSLAEYAVVLGGDGFMLSALHDIIKYPIPIYGINFGHVGFLLNDVSIENIEEKIKKATAIKISPLEFSATSNGKKIKGYAFNELVLHRQNYQTAHIEIKVDNIIRIDEFIGDGVLIATPSGSTGYNRASGGEIIPLQADILSLTAISPSLPRGFKCAICPGDSTFEFNILDEKKRPVELITDIKSYKKISSIFIKKSTKIVTTLLFDSEQSLDEKIINVQFMNYNFDCKNKI